MLPGHVLYRSHHLGFGQPLPQAHAAAEIENMLAITTALVCTISQQQPYSAAVGLRLVQSPTDDSTHQARGSDRTLSLAWVASPGVHPTQSTASPAPRARRSPGRVARDCGRRVSTAPTRTCRRPVCVPAARGMHEDPRASPMQTHAAHSALVQTPGSPRGPTETRSSTIGR